MRPGRELRKIIDRETGILRGADAKASSSVGLEWFALNRWLPMRESTWRKSTRITNMHILSTYIFPSWGSVSLKDVTGPETATWLAKMAKVYSPTIIHKCRVYLKSITAEAVDQEYLQRDPLRKLPMPQMEEGDRPVITAFEARRVIAELPTLRDKLIFQVLLLTGVRPSELFALRWQDWDGTSLSIDEGVVRGDVGKLKTKAAKARVAVPAALAPLIEQWKAEVVGGGTRDWMFPSEKGTPLRIDGWSRRILKPAGERAGLSMLSAQMLRRSFASIAHELGVSMKAVQRQLRHSSMSTTSDVYTQAADSFVQDGVEQVAGEILQPDEEEGKG